MQSSRVGDYTIWYENTEEFYELKKEIFTEHRYYIDLDEDEPVIMDLGANIGLTALYFKKLAPQAKIFCYEPVRENFALLEKNVHENMLEGVELFEAAVAPKRGTIQLQVPSGEGWKSGSGIIARGWRGVLATKPVTCQATAIADVLQEWVDLVKMDIEGMEYEVIASADWSRVGAVMVEVHPRAGKRIEQIEKIFSQSGFQLERREDNTRYGSGLVMLYGHRR